MLNLFFSRCFSPLSAPLEEVTDNNVLLSDDQPVELLCDEDSVLEVLLSLDVSKSNGPDGISARMLKHTAASITPPCCTVI